MRAVLEPSTWLTVAAALHLLQLPTTSWLARRSLKLHLELSRLSELNVRIILIFMGAVSFLVMGLAAVVLVYRRQLLAEPLGRALCLTLGLFWMARAGAQVWLFRVWPRERRGGAIYAGLLGLYGVLAASYLGAWTS